VQLCGLILIVIYNIACAREPLVTTQSDEYANEEDSEQPNGSGPGSNRPTLSSSPAKAITFYQDVLPILEMNESGRNYTCIRCHPSYRNYEIASRSSTADLIISSVSTGFMPLNEGPRMRAEDIAVLKQWRQTGMQEGTPPANQADLSLGAP
jgi:hypothetical protein